MKTTTTKPSLAAAKRAAKRPSKGAHLNALHGAMPKPNANDAAANKRAEDFATDLQRVKDSVKPGAGAKRVTAEQAKRDLRTMLKADAAKQAEREAIRAKRYPDAAAKAAKKANGGGTPQVPAIDGVAPLGIKGPWTGPDADRLNARANELKREGFNPDDAKKIIEEEGRAPKPAAPAPNAEIGGPRRVKLPQLNEEPPRRVVNGGATAEERRAFDEKISGGAKPPAPPIEGDLGEVENVEQLQDRLERSRGGSERVVAEAMAPAEPITAPVTPLRTALLTAAKDDVRFYLQSVRMHLQGNDVRVVSTNGHQLLVQTIPVGARPAWLDAKGVLLSAPDLSAALAVCAKHGENVTISTGVGHPNAQVTSADGFCSFRVGLVEGTFPDYQRIMNDVDLSNEGGDPLAVAQLNPAYVRDATAVAKSLGAKSMQTFAGNEQRAATFLFSGTDAVMVVMPIRDDATTRLVTAKTLAIVGGGMAGSIGALRAHLTRTTEKLKACTDQGERKTLEAKQAEYEQRISELMRLSREALPAPKAKAA